MLQAHPDTTHAHVEVPVMLLLLLTSGVVTILASSLPARVPTAAGGDPLTSSWPRELSRAQVVTRSLSVLVLALVVVCGRAGVDDELENLASALVTGAGWPLLVLGSLLTGTLWRWVDPWDAVARVTLGRDRSSPSSSVWPAVAVVLPWLWFLGVYAQPLDPRAVGAVVAGYSVVTVAGCVALGRARWLSSAEPVGLLLSWFGLLPRRRLSSWEPPRGAAFLLGTVVGGLLFGLVRRTEAWSGVAVRPDATVWSTAALLACCLLGGCVAGMSARVATDAATPTVARAMVPVAAGVVLAVALARNRLFNSVQLLPGLVGDPLGRGWDVFGSPTAGLEPDPLGASGLVALQLGIVICSLALAAATAPRAAVGDERIPVIVTLAIFTLGTLGVLSLH